MDMFKDGSASDLTDVLASRELRVERQHALRLAGNSVIISFQLNIPGPIKTSPGLVRQFESGFLEIMINLERLAIVVTSFEKYYQKTGPECLIACQGNALALPIKTAMIEIENSLQGRLYDIDVLEIKKDCLEGISREQLGLDQRTCLLCEESAKSCGRSRKHSLVDLQAKINDLLRTE